LGYYTTAVAILEKSLKERDSKGKGKAQDAGIDDSEERDMATTALVAMIEIWMSDLWYVSFQDTLYFALLILIQHGGSG
jgi:hypothetical protein